MHKSDEVVRQSRWFSSMVIGSLLLAGSGCEMHSWMDPSVVGRWQRTPVVLPILEKLDVIDEPSTEPPGLTQVMPEDLVPVVQEYIIGPGDLITVTIFQLLVPGVESVQTRRVDELGQIRLPIIGPVQVEGRTPSELENDIAEILVQKGVLRDPTVSVIVQEQRQNTFSVIGESTYASTAIGTYTILGKEFRLLDAMSLARGVPGQIKKLYVIRPAPIGRKVGGSAAADPSALPTDRPAPPPAQGGRLNPADLIDDLLQNPQAEISVEKGVQTAPETSSHSEAPAYINVDGKWVRVAPGAVPPATIPVPAAPPSAESGAAGGMTSVPVQPAAASMTDPASGLKTPADATPISGPAAIDSAVPPAVTPQNILEAKARGQRVIEIPYDKLLEGDTRYNIIIRAGDVIRVPPPVIGNVYIGGAINRPGTYSLPGDKDLTLQQLIFAAGNLSPLAIPERVDLIRRIDKTQQATVRINLRAIFQGTAPDIFLKPNDTINVGTNFVATPLAVLRNGFRMSYGFGFVLDRNFDDKVFGLRRD